MRAVGVMAPLVKDTLKSVMNPLLHFDGVRDLCPTDYRKHVADFFQDTFLRKVDLHLMGSNGVRCPACVDCYVLQQSDHDCREYCSILIMTAVSSCICR